MVEGWILEELEKRGTAVKFDVVSNPEFLREGSAVYDFTHPDRVVIDTNSKRAKRAMKNVYRSLTICSRAQVGAGNTIPGALR